MIRFFFKLVVLGAWASAVGNAAIVISLDYTNAGAVTASDRAALESAKSFWEQQITGYQDGQSRTLIARVGTYQKAASGGSVELAYATPDGYKSFQTATQRYVYASTGAVQINVHADTLSSVTSRETLFRHEFAHMLGFGLLWNTQKSFDFMGGQAGVNVSVLGSGEYTGQYGLAAYRQEFGQAGASFVPVELDGGSATADAHWNESPNSASDADASDQIPAPVSLAGQSLNDELMTGTLSGSLWLSRTSLESFRDIGFTVVPEPSVASFAGIAALGLLRRRRANVG